MSKEMIGANVQEVAEPVIEDESVETQEVAEPVIEENQEETRDFERDSAFAEMRRAREEAERERDRLIAEVEARKAAIVELTGSENGDIEAIAESLGEEFDSVSGVFNAVQESSEKDRKIEELQSQLDDVMADRMVQDTLIEVQAIDPNVKSLEELGETFVELKTKGVDTKAAYWAARSEKDAKKFKAPKAPGKASEDKPEKEFYTEAEWDALTPEQQRKNYKKGLASAQHW